MSEQIDPPRLFEQQDVDPLLRKALFTAAHQAPSAALIEAMTAGAAAGSAAAAASAKVVGTAARLLWLKVGGGVLVSASALYWALSSASPAPHAQLAGPPRPAVVDGQPVASAGAQGTAPAAAAQSSAHISNGAGQASAGQQPTPSSPSAQSPAPAQAAEVSPEASTQLPTREPLAVEDQAQTRPTVVTGSTARRARAQRAAARSKVSMQGGATVNSAQRPASTANSAPTTPERAATTNELALLEQAQHALLGNPQHTLKLLDSHRAHYPRGAFSEERDVLTLDALYRLGRKDELAGSVREFLRAYPSSVHRERVKSLLTAP